MNETAMADDRDDEEEHSVLMLLPLMWVTKMMQANREFLDELDRLQIGEDVKRMFDRKSH
jgi:hypothetical protein